MDIAERKPKYKVGDIVTIKDLGDGAGYHFGTNPEMRALCGKSFKIQNIEWAGLGLGALPDDGYKYILEASSWSWASSMFEDTTKGESTNIDAFINKKKCPVLDFTLH